MKSELEVAFWRIDCDVSRRRLDNWELVEAAWKSWKTRSHSGAPVHDARPSDDHGHVEFEDEVLRIFLDEAARDIRLLEKSCEKYDLAAMVPRAMNLEISCQVVGANKMAMVLEQLWRTAEEMRPEVVRRLLASLNTEYATLRSTPQDYLSQVQPMRVG